VLSTTPPPTPQVEIGSDYFSPWFGYYIDLDRADQGAITSGAAAGVAAVICVQTSGGACPVAAAMLMAAAFYIAINGYCPNKLRM
jgi:hypothetical protein